MEEKNIILSDCHNIPGIKQMYYCFKSSVVNMGYPRRVNQWRINNIELQEGKKLGQLFFIDGEVNFVESPTDTAHGDVYNSKASGQIVSTDELLNSILLGISRNEIILFIEDEKNNLRVVGNKQRGVRLKINTTSNVVSGGLFGYGFSFEYISDEPAYWYAGEIAVEDGEAELAGPNCPVARAFNSDESWEVFINSGAEEEIPDSPIKVNGLDAGNVVSVKPIDVNITDGVDQLPPDSILLVGNTLTIGVTSATPPPTTGDYLVRFFDIDGTILKEEFVDAGNDATAPPTPNYDPTYLVFAEWNQPFTNVQNDIDVGAIYDTVDGKTYLFVRITDTTGLQPAIRVSKATTDLLTINWGDSTTNTTTSSGDITLTKTANYSAIGDYIISIECAGNYGNFDLRNVFNNVASYADSILKFYMGSTFRVNRNSFNSCRFMSLISVNKNYANVVGTINTRDIFGNCFSLRHVNMPSTSTLMEIPNIFNNNYSLKSISLPNTYTAFSGAFQNTPLLRKITTLLQEIATNMFAGSGVEHINLSNSITTASSSAFNISTGLKKFIAPTSLTTLGINLFRQNNITSILEFGPNLTTIDVRAFELMGAALEFVFLSTTPPTLASNSFDATTMKAATKIYVPDASVAAYKAATNWSTWANYIYPLSTRP